MPELRANVGFLFHYNTVGCCWKINPNTPLICRLKKANKTKRNPSTIVFPLPVPLINPNPVKHPTRHHLSRSPWLASSVIYESPESCQITDLMSICSTLFLSLLSFSPCFPRSRCLTAAAWSFDEFRCHYVVALSVYSLAGDPCSIS